MSDQNICISDPSLPSCVDWYPPDDLILPKLEALCRSMPEMPACSLKSYCDNFSKVLIGDHLCLPFSLYSDVCKLDMPGMPDCRVFSQMCSKKSVISACSTAPLTSLPSTHQAKTLVSSICDKMYHDVCSDCVEANGPKTYKNEICKPLEVYGSLCHSMPRMPDCDQFHLLCADAPKLPLCQGLPSHPPTGRAGTPPPSMIMYFHSGFREYFLFDYLVPSSHGEYIGYCFAVFLMAVLYEFLVTFGQKWARTDQSRVSVPGSSINPPDHPNDSSSSSAPLLVQDRALETFQQSYIYLNIQRAIIRGTIRFITASVSYLLMLLSMTFNIGIFLSIMLGLGVGSGLTTFYYPTVLNSAECC